MIFCCTIIILYSWFSAVQYFMGEWGKITIVNTCCMLSIYQVLFKTFYKCKLISSLQSPYKILLLFHFANETELSIMWKRSVCYLSVQKVVRELWLEHRIPIYFHNFVGTGGQNIWNQDYSKKFRSYASHRYITYFI